MCVQGYDKEFELPFADKCVRTTKMRVYSLRLCGLNYVVIYHSVVVVVAGALTKVLTIIASGSKPLEMARTLRLQIDDFVCKCKICKYLNAMILSITKIKISQHNHYSNKSDIMHTCK